MRKTLTILYSFLLVLFCTTGSAQENADKKDSIAMTITYPWNENPVEKNNYSYFDNKDNSTKLAFGEESYKVLNDNEMELRFTSFVIRPDVNKQEKSNYYKLEKLEIPKLKIIFDKQKINDLTDTYVSYINMDSKDIDGKTRYIKVIINPTKKTGTSEQIAVKNDTLISYVKRLDEKINALELETKQSKLIDDAPFNNELLLWLALGLAVIAIASCVFVVIRFFGMEDKLSSTSEQLHAHLKASDKSDFKHVQNYKISEFDNSKNEERLLKIENDMKEILKKINCMEAGLSIEKVNAGKESENKVDAEIVVEIPHSKKTFTVDGLDGFNDNTITNNLSYVEGIFKLVQIADNKIEFMVNENSEIQRNNMQSIRDIVFKHCITSNIVPRINRIINDKPGVLEKIDGKWEIVEKAKIMLE